MNRDGETVLVASDMPEQRACTPSLDSSGEDGLALSEAAQLYDVSLRSLRRLITLGGIPAHKIKGARGQEWRVTAATLDAAGYAPRLIDLTQAEDPNSSEVRRLTQALVAAQARNAELDGRLGYALLTVGRLRGRLRDAGINPDELFGADLEAEEAPHGER